MDKLLHNHVFFSIIMNNCKLDFSIHASQHHTHCVSRPILLLAFHQMPSAVVSFPLKSKPDQNPEQQFVSRQSCIVFICCFANGKLDLRDTLSVASCSNHSLLRSSNPLSFRRTFSLLFWGWRDNRGRSRRSLKFLDILSFHLSIINDI